MVQYLVLNRLVKRAVKLDNRHKARNFVELMPRLVER
jgi:hypothetical protein